MPTEVPELTLRGIQPEIVTAVDVATIVAQPDIIAGAPEQIGQRILAAIEQPAGGEGEEVRLREGEGD